MCTTKQVILLYYRIQNKSICLLLVHLWLISYCYIGTLYHKVNGNMAIEAIACKYALCWPLMLFCNPSEQPNTLSLFLLCTVLLYYNFIYIHRESQGIFLNAYLNKRIGIFNTFTFNNRLFVHIIFFATIFL